MLLLLLLLNFFVTTVVDVDTVVVDTVVVVTAVVAVVVVGTESKILKYTKIKESRYFSNRTIGLVTNRETKIFDVFD